MNFFWLPRNRDFRVTHDSSRGWAHAASLMCCKRLRRRPMQAFPVVGCIELTPQGSFKKEIECLAPVEALLSQLTDAEVPSICT